MSETKSELTHDVENNVLVPGCEHFTFLCNISSTVRGLPLKLDYQSPCQSVCPILSEPQFCNGHKKLILHVAGIKVDCGQIVCQDPETSSFVKGEGY